MRDIKFRAWQPHTSLHRKPGMYMVDDIVWYEKDSEGHSGEVFLAKHIGWSQSSEYTDEIKLMQYTGLKDKNGVEIYEGDIWQIGGLNGDGLPRIGVVQYENGAFIIRTNPGGMTETYTGGNMPHGEVIGNIYENRELLENKEK